MKRTLVLLSVAALAAGPAAHAATKVPAKKPTTRTVTWAYQGPAGANADSSTVSVCNDSTCTSIPLQAYETKAVISVTDGSGQKVALLTEVDGAAGITCGSGEVTLVKNTQLDLKAVLDPTCPALPTQGTVTVTITGLK